MEYTLQLTFLIEAETEQEAIEELKENINCGIGVSDFEFIKPDTE